MRFGLRISFIALLLSGSTQLYADSMENLYEATIPVVSQALEERTGAIQEALKSVLVRVSGRSMVSNLSVLEEAVQNAPRYMQQFRYRTGSLENAATNQSSQVLWVSFDKQAVNKILRDNQLPVWGHTRPSVLVWLVIDYGGRRDRQLISANLRHSARNSIELRAKQRGIPLRLPLMDLADRSNIQAGEVWANFEAPIMRASKRYQADAVLVGRAYKSSSGLWSSRWTFYLEGRRQDWDFQAKDMASALTPSIDYATDALSMQFTQATQIQQRNRVRIQIKDIKGLADYTRAIDYLGSLSSVTKIQPLQIEASNVTFELTARSGRLGVAQAVSLGHILASEIYIPPTTQITHQTPDVTMPIKPVSIPPDLVYRLLP